MKAAATIVGILALGICLFFVVSEPKSASIWEAAGIGNVAEIERHLAVGTDIDAGDPIGGGPPLSIASLFGHTEATALLIEKGANVDATSRDGNNALHGAAFLCHAEVVALLIEKGIDVNHRNNRGETALDSVTRPWNQSLKDLYAGLAAILQTDAEMDRIERVRPEVAELIRRNGGENNPDLDVWVAAMTGHRTIVEKYLAAGNDIEAREPGGSALLIMASLLGQTDIAELLIEKGEDLDARNGEGNTALYSAVALCQREAVELLLEKGADPDVKNNKGETALAAVTTPWSEELAGLYGFVGLILQNPLDVDRIERDRPKMAELLRQHADGYAGKAAAPGS